MNDRKLDGQICKEVFGWEYVTVGPDAKGEGACKILAPSDKMPQEWYNQLPLKGAIPETWNCPHYTDRLDLAIELCLLLGYNPDLKLSEIKSLKPIELCHAALNLFRSNQKVAIKNISIKKVHRKCWTAYFKMWPVGDSDMKIDMEYSAPTEERLKEKIEHLKRTGIILRD